tara:strand:+ start:942 stop:1121 length:180 start_codon:yes stop_codon:yes gene_type:complete
LDDGRRTRGAWLSPPENYQPHVRKFVRLLFLGIAITVFEMSLAENLRFINPALLRPEAV